MLKKQNIFQRMFSFAGEMERGEFWSDVAMRIISCFCAMIVCCIVLAVAVPVETEELIEITNIVVPILGVVWILPIIPRTRRRLRDAGYSAKTYYWLLLPGIGGVAFVVRLCGQSASDKK